MVDGTVYEVSGGKTMVDGTVYSINGGKTMVDGTVYDLFKKKQCTITVTKDGFESGAGAKSTCVEINGVQYGYVKAYQYDSLAGGAVLKDTGKSGTVIVDSGTQIICTFTKSSIYGEVTVNGTTVATASPYTYTVKGSVNISTRVTSTNLGGRVYYYGVIKITDA